MSVFELPPALVCYIAVLVFASGACVGSFVNCACVRLKDGKSSLTGRSRCPACGRILGASEIVPIFSYLFLHGRCRGCGAKIDFLSFVSEAALAAAYMASLFVFGISFYALEAAALFTVICAESLCDVYTQEVPDFLHAVCAAVFVIFTAAYPKPSERVTSGLLGAFLYGAGILLFSLASDRIFGRESLGGADIKLIAVLGLFFGPVRMLLLVILSCVFGLATVVFKKTGRGEPFPFIPCISVAAFVTLLFGDIIIERYLGLYGLFAAL